MTKGNLKTVWQFCSVSSVLPNTFFFTIFSTGAADDLVKATDTARSMVLRYGMDKDLGHVAYERERPPMLGTPAAQGWHAREFSDETERLMDHAVRDLVGHAFDRAVEDSQRAPVGSRKDGTVAVAARDS